MPRNLFLSLVLLLSALPAASQPKTSGEMQEFRGYLIDLECDPIRNAREMGAQPGQGTPPPGCGAGSNTTRYAIYGDGKILRFDDASNQTFRTYTETNASLKYAMVNNNAGQPRLRVVATGRLNGDVLTVNKVRRLNRLSEQPTRARP